MQKTRRSATSCPFCKINQAASSQTPAAPRRRVTLYPSRASYSLIFFLQRLRSEEPGWSGGRDETRGRGESASQSGGGGCSGTTVQKFLFVGGGGRVMLPKLKRRGGRSVGLRLFSQSSADCFQRPPSHGRLSLQSGLQTRREL